MSQVIIQTMTINRSYIISSNLDSANYFLLNTLRQTNNLLPFLEQSVQLYFFNMVQIDYLRLTLKVT